MPSEALPVIVDTSVVSILFDKRKHHLFYEERLRQRRAVISFQTLEEMWFGALDAGWGDKRRNRLRDYLSLYKVIWPDGKMVETSAQLRSLRKRQGRELKKADAWIAATALTLGCPLATHNRDFEGIPDLVLIKAS